MSRAVSTVVDVTLCLLLLSASTVVLLSASPPEDQQDRSTAAATTVGTATTAVSYETPDGETAVRRGTLAELLAAAAMANATVHERGAGSGAVGPGARVGEQACAGNCEFVAATRRAVEHELVATAPSDDAVRTQVRAVWQPHPDVPLRGSVVAGPTPSPTADVNVATFRVPVGRCVADGAASTDRARNESNRNRAGVAAPSGTNRNATSSVNRSGDRGPNALANATLACLLPRAATRPLPANRPAPVAIDRYDSLQKLLVQRERRVDAADNRTLAERRLRHSLAEQYRRAGVDDARVGTVEIVVRTWVP